MSPCLFSVCLRALSPVHLRLGIDVCWSVQPKPRSARLVSCQIARLPSPFFSPNPDLDLNQARRGSTARAARTLLGPMRLKRNARAARGVCMGASAPLRGRQCGLRRRPACFTRACVPKGSFHSVGPGFLLVGSGSGSSTQLWAPKATNESGSVMGPGFR